MLHHKFPRPIVILGVFLITIGAIHGCSRKIVNEENSGGVNISISAKHISSHMIEYVERFRLTISAGDIDPIIMPLQYNNGILEGDTIVPEGRSRRFVAEALDVADNVIYRGETTTDIRANAEITLNITLLPVVPLVNFTPHHTKAVMGEDFSVEVNVFGIPLLTTLIFNFNYGTASGWDVINFDSIVIDSSLVNIGRVSHLISFPTAEITVSPGDAFVPIIDSTGNAHLATIYFSSHIDTPNSAETAALLPELMYVGIFDGATEIPLSLASVYADRAIIELAKPLTWQGTIGGAQFEEGYSILEVDNNGYLIAGVTFSFGARSSDVYLLKTDSAGNEDWHSIVGGSDYDGGMSMIHDGNGGYVVAGWTQSMGSGGDVYLIKTDRQGVPVWEKSYGGPGTDEGRCVNGTSDGGYGVVGWSETTGEMKRQVYFVKTDASGNPGWDKDYGDLEDEEGYSFVVTPDGDYVIVGYSTSVGAIGKDVYLIKISNTGEIVWQKMIGGDGEDIGYDILSAHDGGFIIAGSTTSLGAGAQDAYLVKTDSLGNFAWHQTFGGSLDDGALAVIPTRDNGYALAGFTSSFGQGGRDVYLIKADAGGNLQWQQTFGGPETDQARDVISSSDGGFVIIGGTDSFGQGMTDVFLIKTDAQGITSY